MNLVVEIKGYRGEQAKQKKLYMDTYWVPGVNNSRGLAVGHLRVTDIFSMPTDLNDEITRQTASAELESNFAVMITATLKAGNYGA